MFNTPVGSFRYAPLVREGHIVRNWVKLTQPLEWNSDDGVRVQVPVGFEFNLASVPWWLGFVAQKLGRHQRAAALHDYLYKEGIGSRSWADEQFSAAMAGDRVRTWRRRTMWLGVRALGLPAWWMSKYRRQA